jgi:putative sterol carrier protein
MRWWTGRESVWHLPAAELRGEREVISLENMTARELIETMPAAFRPERARRVNAVIQFELSGEGGGNWYVTIKDGTCTVTEGVSEAAQGTIMMAATDYVALAAGEIGGMKAFLTGRIKTTGDFTLLKKMETWFPR